jgi:predicted MFS family arabinose efflux permease
MSNGSTSEIDAKKKRSVRALEWTNFFVADVQTGLGPFLAAYLAGAGWAPDKVGLALTLGGAVTVVLQIPAGALVDRARSKRAIVAAASAVLAVGAILLSLRKEAWAVYSAQVMIGGAGPFLAPTLAALTMGLVGAKGFDRQFGRNQSFNSAGNVACAALIAGVSHWFGNQAIFLTAAFLVIPTIASVMAINSGDIDYAAARGGFSHRKPGDGSESSSILQVLLQDRVLLVFLICAFLFHFANAAMLPQLGELLAKGRKESAAPFMSACVVVTQVVITCSAAWIGRFANAHGRKPLLLIGFGVLPVRAFLYTVIRATAGLIAVQILDGVANAIFTVVSVLVVADRTQGTGRFNLAQGALATAVGMGAALSNTFGGDLVQHGGYNVSFLALGGVAAAAFGLLAIALPETRKSGSGPNQVIPSADTSSGNQSYSRPRQSSRP